MRIFLCASLLSLTGFSTFLNISSAQDTDPQGNIDLLLKMPDLVAFWTFGEESGKPRVSLTAEGKYPLHAVGSPVERVPGGPFSGYSARFNGKNYLRIPYEETGALNIAGKDAQVSVIAFIRLEKVRQTSVAGMWSEGKGKNDDTGTRQYALLVDMPAYGGRLNVTPHISSEGGVTRRRDNSPLPWCVDYAANVSRVPANKWVSVGFTYDSKYICAYFNGVLEPRAVQPKKDNRADSYFTQEGPNGGSRGMNPYYHGRGIFKYDKRAKYNPPKMAPPDFVVGARYVVGSMLRETMKGSIGGLLVFDRALSKEEMLTVHQAANLKRLNK